MVTPRSSFSLCVATRNLGHDWRRGGPRREAGGNRRTRGSQRVRDSRESNGFCPGLRFCYVDAVERRIFWEGDGSQYLLWNHNNRTDWERRQLVANVTSTLLAVVRPTAMPDSIGCWAVKG